MEITQQQAYEVALSIIGRMTVEQHFYRATVEAQARDLDAARAGEESPRTNGVAD